MSIITTLADVWRDNEAAILCAVIIPALVAALFPLRREKLRTNVLLAAAFLAWYLTCELVCAKVSLPRFSAPAFIAGVFSLVCFAGRTLRLSLHAVRSLLSEKTEV